MEKRDELLKSQLSEQISGGIRDATTNRTLIKAKTLLTNTRIKKLDYEILSLKSPWVENPIKWNNILKIWQNFTRNLKQLEDRLDKEIFKLRVGDELQQGVMKLAKVYIAQKRKVSIGGLINIPTTQGAASKFSEALRFAIVEGSRR